MIGSSHHHQHYQIRAEEGEERNKEVQWSVICDCFPVKVNANDEELRRLAQSRRIIIAAQSQVKPAGVQIR